MVAVGHNGAHGIHDGGKSLPCWCLACEDLFLSPGILKAEYRYSVLVYRLRVDLAIVGFAGQGHSPARPAAAGAEPTPDVVLQVQAVPAAVLHSSIPSRHFAVEVGDKVRHSPRWACPHPASDFDMVAPREIQFTVVLEPRSVDVGAAHTVFVEALPVRELGKDPMGARSGGIVQEFSDEAAAVG